MKKIKCLIILGVFSVFVSGTFSLLFSDDSASPATRANGSSVAAESAAVKESKQAQANSMETQLREFGPEVPSVEIPPELQRLIGVRTSSALGR